MQQGPFAPRELPRFVASTDPAATVSSSADFPGSPVIRPTFLRRFRGGTRTASPVARHVLVTVLPLLPRRSDTTHRSGFVVSCCLRPRAEGSASGVFSVTGPPMGSLALRPGDLRTILKMALSIGFTSFVSSTDAIQATRSLILTSVGLSPTEHASLRWTHRSPKTVRERLRSHGSYHPTVHGTAPNCQWANHAGCFRAMARSQRVAQRWSRDQCVKQTESFRHRCSMLWSRSSSYDTSA